MDRIDLQVEVPPVTPADLALPPPAEGTAEAAARVARARSLQAERAQAAGAADQSLNARLEGKLLETAAAPDASGKALLSRAAEGGSLSARGWARTLRLARTIADLDGADRVGRLHIAEALIYRRTPLEGAASPTPGSLATSAVA